MEERIMSSLDNMWDDVWTGLLKKIEKLDSVVWEKEEMSKDEKGTTHRIKRFAAIIDNDGSYGLKIEVEKEATIDHNHGRIDPSIKEDGVEYHIRIYEVNNNTKYEKILRTFRRPEVVKIFNDINSKLTGQIMSKNDKMTAMNTMNDSRHRLMKAFGAS